MIGLLGIFAALCTGPKDNDRSGIIESSNLPKACADQATLSSIYLWIFAVVGALAVLFLVIGGTRYALAGGDPEKVKKAKNEILYSMIGLVIAALAAVIVKYVINQLPK